MFPPAAYFSSLPGVPGPGALVEFAAAVGDRVFRTDFARPGFSLTRLPASTTSGELRAFMIALVGALDDFLARRHGRRLRYLSLGRFDQQGTTRFHQDGAPEESFLLLGYEPSEVVSEVALADFAHAAHRLGMSAPRYLVEHNPMVPAGAAALAGFITRLEAFDPASAQVLLINNSAGSYDPAGASFLGVLHQATIPEPRADRTRVINSVMLGTTAAGAAAGGWPLEVAEFLRAEAIAGRLYG